MNGKRSANSDFDTFVKNQQPAGPQEASIDWAGEREKWLRDLEELYRQIETFLAQYIKGGTITREYDEIELNEENIGSYRARRMLLRIGRQQVTLTPVGTFLIGARGRVDLVGPAGRTRFVLVDSEASRPQVKVTVSFAGQHNAPAKEEARRDIKWAWKIATNAPTIRYIDLTQESLFQALMEVANG
jgi:hypothetical protein